MVASPPAVGTTGGGTPVPAPPAGFCFVSRPAPPARAGSSLRKGNAGKLHSIHLSHSLGTGISYKKLPGRKGRDEMWVVAPWQGAGQAQSQL